MNLTSPPPLLYNAQYCFALPPTYMSYVNNIRPIMRELLIKLINITAVINPVLLTLAWLASSPALKIQKLFPTIAYFW